ncbi:MAG: cation:dicarboxylase symporter family transporter [Pseudomonadota bacterium]|nr:cation:dicarboxylase symporter family transporter [Pseudomonadota bacterium]
MNESSPQTAGETRKGPGFRMRRISLSTAILAGMVLGIAAGVFFGEYVAFLGIIGNGFIRLLQMSILPYILVSLILGIGGLTYAKARLLAVKAGLLLLLTRVIAFAFILKMPLGFPSWESASFFSSALVEFPPPPNFLILTCWVLPMLVAAATPFKYQDVIDVSRDALVTAFTTGNLFTVLSVLTEGGKRLFAEYD